MVLSINQTHGLDIEFPTTTKKELTLFRVLELFFHYPAMAEDVFFLLLFIASVFLLHKSLPSSTRLIVCNSEHMNCLLRVNM